MKRLLVLLAAIALVPVAANAAPTYCVPGPNTDGLSLTDVWFGTDSEGAGGVSANDCYGIVDGNNDLDVMNALAWGDIWDVELKDDMDAAGPGQIVHAGMTWTLSAVAATEGVWTLALSGVPPGALPFMMDFAVVLKAGSQWAAYLFEDAVFQATNYGYFYVQFVVGKDSTPNLSHMSLYLPKTVTEVPEPASLLLLGSGLVGLGAYARKRRRA